MPLLVRPQFISQGGVMAFSSRLERERENERGIGVGRQGGTPCIYKPKLVRAKKKVFSVSVSVSV